MNKDETSYKQIIKSTSVIGGAKVIEIAISVIRTKIVALLLGPVGVGLIGMFQSIPDLVRNITGFGINFSGVKDIAQANGTGDQNKITEAVTVLKKWTLITAFLGVIVVLLFAKPLIVFTFGNLDYINSALYLAIIVFFTTFSASQLTLLQGMQQIERMAKAQIFSAIASLLISVPVYFILGTKGITLSLTLMAISIFFVTFYYSKGIKIPKKNITFTQTWYKGIGMIKLGLFMTVNSFVGIFSLYYIRKFILQQSDIETVGVFQASWSITNQYIGLILNAMLTDFFPRLSKYNSNNDYINRNTNEQLTITLLIGTPVILCMFIFAGFVIQVLYSNDFSSTVNILQLQLYGSLFTLIGWPVGVIPLAKGKGLYSMINDILTSSVFILLICFLWPFFDVNILGYSFIIRAVLSVIIVYSLSYKLTKYKTTHSVKKIIFISFIIMTLSLTNTFLVKIELLKICINLFLLLFSIVFSYVQLNKVIDIKMVVKTVLLRFKVNKIKI